MDNQEDIDAFDSNDTIVQFVQKRESDQVFQHQLIEVIHNTWAIPGSRTIFESGILSKSSGIGRRSIVPKNRIVEVDLQTFLEIYNLFKSHHFEWITKKPGHFGRHLSRDFYSTYASTHLNEVFEASKKRKKVATLRSAPLDEVFIHGAWMDISKTSINRFLHGPEYNTPIVVGLYENCHHSVRIELEMSDHISHESIMRWIAWMITSDSEAASHVANPRLHITKTSLTFPAKVWWAIVRVQLCLTINDNILSPSNLT
ncbi:hypothetical protein KY284_008038 [Solanum tuberosum]|nr:hypothetical protein KY284_008038 [Solanum tuberosum]